MLVKLSKDIKEEFSKKVESAINKKALSLVKEVQVCNDKLLIMMR